MQGSGVGQLFPPSLHKRTFIDYMQLEHLQAHNLPSEWLNNPNMQSSQHKGSISQLQGSLSADTTEETAGLDMGMDLQIGGDFWIIPTRGMVQESCLPTS